MPFRALAWRTSFFRVKHRKKGGEGRGTTVSSKLGGTAHDGAKPCFQGASVMGQVPSRIWRCKLLKLHPWQLHVCLIGMHSQDADSDGTPNKSRAGWGLLMTMMKNGSQEVCSTSTASTSGSSP